MPNQTTPKPRHRGWFFDQVNNRLKAIFNGTTILDFDGDDIAVSQALVSTAAVSTSSTITGTGTGSKLIAPTGNVALGAPAAFATTQPQGAVIMGGTSKSGIAPVGAVATSGAVFASDTVVRKIIADGTASNVET